MDRGFRDNKVDQISRNGSNASGVTRLSLYRCVQKLCPCIYIPMLGPILSICYLVLFSW